ncbi:hypothetical protein Efla_003152 [Eimeria flavescens]
MTRGLSDSCDRACGQVTWCASAPAVSWSRSASRSQPLSKSLDGLPPACPWGSLQGHLALQQSLTCGPSSGGFGAVVSRSDSAWDAFNEALDGQEDAAAPAVPFATGLSRAEEASAPSLIKSCRDGLDSRGPFRYGCRPPRCMSFRKLFQKCFCKGKVPVSGHSGVSTEEGLQSDSPYRFCLLTFRDPQLEESYRSSRLRGRTSSSLGISVLFLLVLSSVCPVYGKVLFILGAPRSICFSFTVGCGVLIGLWVLHGCVVAVRKKIKISDKLVIHLTLFLISLTLLLVLTWGNAYLCVDAMNQQRGFLRLTGFASPSSETPQDEAAADTYLPCGGAARRLSSEDSLAGGGDLLLSPPSPASSSQLEKPPSAAAGAPRAAGAPQGEASAADCSTEEALGQRMGAPLSTEVKTHYLLLPNMFVLLLIMTLSVAAVYSLTEFAPAFLAWSWPLYVVFPFLTVATTVVSNVLLNHDLAAEATYIAVVLSMVIWGCGFANRYVCEAGHRAEFFFSEEASKRMQPQATAGSMGSASTGAAAAASVDELQQLAVTALRLIIAVSGRANTCSQIGKRGREGVKVLIATLAKTEHLYSRNVMQALGDKAAAHRWLSGEQLGGGPFGEGFSWSPDPSVVGAPVSMQGHQQHSCREMIHSSLLLEEGPWLNRHCGSMDSSARRSGSDWCRLPSEGVVIEPVVRSESPEFLASAFAAAGSRANSQPQKASSLSELHVSVPEAAGTAGLAGQEAAAAAAAAPAPAGIQAAANPSSHVLSSLLKTLFTLGQFHPTREAAGDERGGGGGRGGGGILVDELLETQLKTLKTPERDARPNEFVGDVVACSRALHEVALVAEHRSVACSAFAGIGADWDLDVLCLAQSYQGTLQHVGWILLRPFVNILNCGSRSLLRLLQQLEVLYDPELPYHTATHACQVAHAAMVLNSELGLDPRNEKIGSFCLCLAALAHDVGHLGKTNGFLQQSRHPLAIIYNDQSIMENFHSSLLFRIINEIPSTNVFRSQSSESYQAIRQQIIALILATDLEHHVDLMSRCRITRSSPEFDFVRREEDATHVRKMMLKMADLSHTLLCWRDHFTWTCKISEEFYRQGDAERRLKLPISPFCNRECHQFLAQNQVSFLKILVEPLLCELEGVERAGENQNRALPFISETLRKRYENNVERWSLLENSGMYIVFDNETLSRGFYRASDHLEGHSGEES